MSLEAPHDVLVVTERQVQVSNVTLVVLHGRQYTYSYLNKSEVFSYTNKAMLIVTLHVLGILFFIPYDILNFSITLFMS